jgi:hypothetical protein
MPSRIGLPESSRGRARLVAVLLAATFSGVAVLSTAMPHTELSTAGIGLGAPSSVPIAAHFPVTSRSTTRPSSTSVLPTSTTTPTADATPVRAVPVDAVIPSGGSEPTPTTVAVPLPVPTTGPRILLAPAVTATLPPPPPPLGASALTWTAPHTFDIPAGTTSALTVVGHNPTDRAVDLPHPLACTPRLDHGETCAPEVQRIPAHTSATATFTIDATGVAPGAYTLSIEGVLTIPVTVS